MGPDARNRRAISDPSLSALAETAYAKLNLTLHVRGRLPDGRHRIETIFAFCEDGDELRAQRSESLRLTIDGPEAGGLLPEDNLVLRAANALSEVAGVRDGSRLDLTKRLPVAAGIGGGSADAAAALRLLTGLWELDPAHAKHTAPKIGSDVPACLLSRPCRGFGAGDELEPVDLPELAGKAVLLVNPRVPLSTASVFARWDGVDRGPLDEWREGRNDLAAPAISLVPVIAEVLDWLSARPGAEFVRMSGSGATCFALFDSMASRDGAAAAVPPGWWHLASRLR